MQIGAISTSNYRPAFKAQDNTDTQTAVQAPKNGISGKLDNVKNAVTTHKTTAFAIGAGIGAVAAGIAVAAHKGIFVKMSANKVMKKSENVLTDAQKQIEEMKELITKAQNSNGKIVEGDKVTGEITKDGIFKKFGNQADTYKYASFIDKDGKVEVSGIREFVSGAKVGEIYKYNVGDSSAIVVSKDIKLNDDKVIVAGQNYLFTNNKLGYYNVTKNGTKNSFDFNDKGKIKSAVKGLTEDPDTLDSTVKKALIFDEKGKIISRFKGVYDYLDDLRI